jgi:Cu-processing system permease protein
MSTTMKIARYQLRDVMRSRWALVYLLFFGVTTDVLFRFSGHGEQVLVSLMNVALLVVPLAGMVLGAIYLYGAREYVELLLAHPVNRRSLFLGLFLGLALPLSGAFLVGVGVPFIYHGGIAAVGGVGVSLLLGTGVLLTVTFVALAFAIALATEDRIKGLGAALVVWLGMVVLWDGLILLVLGVFGGYPVEIPVLVLSIMNPVDLGRIALLLHMDVSALMGATGAVVERFFGSTMGQGLALGALLAWLAIPLALAGRTFQRKNF